MPRHTKLSVEERIERAAAMRAQKMAFAVEAKAAYLRKPLTRLTKLATIIYALLVVVNFIPVRPTLFKKL